MILSNDAKQELLIIMIGMLFSSNVSSDNHAELKEVRLLGLLPMSGAWSGGRPCLQAINMAIKDINAREDVLQNYNLKFDYIDTKVSIQFQNKMYLT